MPFHSSAQQTSKNRIIVGVAPQLYLNNFNEESGNKLPTSITAKNILNPTFMVGYERVTRQGFLWGGSLLTGIQKHNITISRNFSDFDPRADSVLKDVVFTERIIRQNWYVAPRLHVGYRKQISPSLALTTRAGAAIKFRLPDNSEKETTEYKLHVIAYQFDNSTSTTPNVIYGFMQRYLSVRNDNIYTSFASIGSEYKFKNHLLKEIFAEIEVARNWFGNDSYVTTASSISALLPPDPPNIAINTYLSRDYTISLRLGIRCWK